MIGENTNNIFVSFTQQVMASVVNLNGIQSCPFERKLSVKEPKALAALVVQIHERGWGGMVPFDMKVFHLWLHEQRLKWSQHLQRG